ncbi:MAG: YfiR family protein [Pseudomonadota bacterium]|nr:YfiR family protein [Pseudomonadota bacterium]
MLSIKPWGRALSAVLLVCLPTGQLWAQDKPVTSPEVSLSRMIHGILNYTRWSIPNPIHLCVVDSPQYVQALQLIQTESRNQVQVLAKSAKEPDLTQQCHVLFFVHTPPEQQQAILNQRGVHQILSLSLNNTDCVVGSSFCLTMRQGVPSFSVNLDSLKQSGIRISSNVLMLAKPHQSREDE